MALRVARDALSRIFYQRCFYLFGALLALISVVPFLPETIEGRIVLNWVNVFLVVSTVAAVGRSVFSFVLALLLGVGELLLHWTALKGGVPGSSCTRGCWARSFTPSRPSTSCATSSTRRS